MGVQRIFSLFIFLIALVGIFGSRGLPLFTVGNISNGFTPLLYSLCLLLASIVLFFQGKQKSGEKINFREWLLQGARGKAFVFFLLNILMVVLLPVFGSFISMLAFSVLVCLTLKQLSLRVLILFSVVYVVIIYILFVFLLKMPFPRGLIFDLMLGYI